MSAVVDLLRDKAPWALDALGAVGKAVEPLTGPENPPVNMVLSALNKADPMNMMQGPAMATHKLVRRQFTPKGTVRAEAVKASEPGYLYHATNVERANEIAASRMKLHEPWEFTDQGAWPDGSVKPRAYFSPRAQSTAAFAPEEGPSVVLRTPEGKNFRRESGTGDVVTERPISSRNLEIATPTGWEALSSPEAAAAKVLRGPRLTEARRDILFDRKGPANEPIRDLKSFDVGTRDIWRPRETEMMKVEDLKKLREFNRGDGTHPGGVETIDALKSDLAAYGAENPLMVSYWHPDRKAIIGEGNHRLEAAIQSGIEELPVRVYGSDRPVGNRDLRGGRIAPVEVPGSIKRGAGELKPSEIGLPSRPLTPEEWAENGKKIRIGYPEHYMTDAERRARASDRFSNIAGEMRDTEWSARNPEKPLEPSVQYILDLLQGR
jgi:hypothetical protein